MPAPMITHPALLSIHYPKPPQAGREHQAPLPPPNIPEDSAVVQNPHGRVRGLLRMTNRFPVYGTSNTGWRGSQQGGQHFSTPPCRRLISTLQPPTVAYQHVACSRRLLSMSATQLSHADILADSLRRRRSRRAEVLTSGARRAQRAVLLSWSGSLYVCARAPDDLLPPVR